MAKKNYLDVLKKNAMLIVLVLVYIFFTITTGGQMFQAMNFNALITQNAYVFVLATGKQKVNFDAFAALATDVMQYAIIDGAMSAESAYGLPAARDMQ